MLIIFYGCPDVFFVKEWCNVAFLQLFLSWMGWVMHFCLVLHGEIEIISCIQF